MLPSDTAHPDTTAATAKRISSARFRIQPAYSMIGAAMSVGDAQLLTRMYASNAELTVSDGSLSGSDKVVRALVNFGKRLTLKEFERRPEVTVFLSDSVLADSGAYRMISQRPGASEVVQFGKYAATWRIKPDTVNWVMLTDHIYAGTVGTSRTTPAPPAKKGD